MSLSEAILEIAKEMEEDVKQILESGQVITAETFTVLLYGHIRALRASVKAVEGIEPSPVRSNRDMIEAAKAEFRKNKGEVEETVMAEIMDGPDFSPSLTTYHAISSKMPIGAKTLLPSGNIYQLESNGKLYHYYEAKEEAK